MGSLPKSRSYLLLASFQQFPVSELHSRSDQRHQMSAGELPPPPLHCLQRLKIIANPARQEPGPLMMSVLALTGANTDSIGLVVRRCRQCSAG